MVSFGGIKREVRRSSALTVQNNSIINSHLGNLTSIFGDEELFRNSPRQTKVTQLDLAVNINKYIGRFDIPMHYVGRVEEVNRAQSVIQYS